MSAYLTRYLSFIFVLIFSGLCHSVNMTFMKAIEKSDIKLIKQIIREGVDLNDPIDNHGLYTPLQYASFVGTTEVIVLLASASVSASLCLNPVVQHHTRRSTRYTLREKPRRRYVSASCRSEYFQGGVHMSPLHLAATAGHISSVQSLISMGADAFQVSPPGWGGLSVLAYASRSGNVELGQLILQYDPSQINRVKAPGWSALHEAFQAHNFKFFLFLLDSGANPNIEVFGSSLLAYMLIKNYSNSYAFIIAMIQHGAQLPSCGADSDNSPLTVALNADDIYLSGILIPAYLCSDVNYDGAHSQMTVPTLQEWAAHFIRSLFSFQQISNTPLPQYLILYVLGTYADD